MIIQLRRVMTMLVLGASLAGSVRASDWSLQFNGTNQYATFGAATSTLGASNFTLECWFKRTGTGVTTTTGSGGITAVPLVTKGRGENDNSNVDCNYFLGITSAGVLGADFEEGAGKTSPGLNHPVSGATTILNDRWYHAAVTFDGTTWKLYLDGALDGTLNLGTNRGPRFDSIQHAGIASALTSTGAAAGFFQGRIDEVRIWNVARSQAEILTSMRAKLPTATGLLGRWSLDEGSGTTIVSSAGTTVNGTLMNTPVWSIDSPFAVVPAGSVWKHLDNGSDQGTVWRATGFNDTVWAGGPAELGYGDGGEATVLTYGPDANNKYVTTYFRQTFQVTNAASYSGLDISLVRDDGAIVYLNGTEIWRSNMPTGDVPYNMYASSPEVSGTDESKWFNTTVPTAQFVEGPNVVAVEVHQQRAGSSDISFNLKLAASRTDNANPPPVVSLTAPSAAAVLPVGTPVTLTASATDNGSVSKVEFFANGAKLGEPATSPFNFVWTPATAAHVTITAKATDDQGATTTSVGVNVTVYESGTGALQFDGVNDHVTFGSATNLGAASFTLECWMRKLGAGVTSSSGNGGIVAVPLITKGRGEAENSNVDCNYFFGILPGGALAADFEQFYADGGAAGQNYPVTGNSIGAADGNWHHVAVTYDGSSWVLYVDGTADKTLNIGNHTPRFDSIQHAGIGVAMTSAGATEGAFDGNLDEVRIWNYARTAQQISDNRSNSISVAAGLLGRWSLNDGGGTSAANSVAGQPNGTLVNGPLWCAGMNLTAASNTPPVVLLTAPANGAHFDTGATINLTAASFDDGIVTGVEFFRDGISLGSDTTSPYSATWFGVPAGDYALTAIATDGTGLAATSAVVTVSVTTPNLPPNLSVLSPTNGAMNVALSTNLAVTVSDPEAGTLTVSFYGRLKTAVTPGADFTVVALPDTQFYSQTYPNVFQRQTDWIVANRTNLNIVYVAHLGDIVNDGDSQPVQWPNATNALYRLENPATTGLPEGIPYGVVPGNHDHVGNTVQYNTWFGTNHFAGRSYYGGHYGSDNQNHYDLISASGMNFIFLFQDFNYTSLDYAPLDAWADGVLKTNADRRAIVISHDILAVGGGWDSRGQVIYENLKDNPNLFLMLCGHNHGEGDRQDTFEGRTVHSCLSDYQSYANGGNGYLRLYQFSPAGNVIHVKTYSPYLGLYETDANSQFDIPYAMSGVDSSEPFALLGVSSNVASGSAASSPWSGLLTGTNYEWYAVVSDGANSVTSPVAAFTTAQLVAPVLTNAAATDVDCTNATVNGAVLSTGGNKPDVRVYWGLSDGGTDPEAWGESADLGAQGLGLLDVSLKGLHPGTDYFFRFYGTNLYGEAWASSSKSFSTLSGVPAIRQRGGPAVTNAVSVNAIDAGSVWKYLDNGSNQGSAWQAPAFDDGVWVSGPAKLGYGDANNATTLGYGPNSASKYITYYFRRHFTAPADITWTNLYSQLVRDDGAVVHLNGTELFRDNMPSGTITYQTWSSSIVDGAAETTFYPFSRSADGILAGDNVLAVEIHQRDGTSSDLGFDFSLVLQGYTVTPGAEAVSNVTDISAVALGEITTGGAEMPGVFCYYGTTDGGTNAGSWQSSIMLGMQPSGPVDALLEGLTPVTTYFYRFCVSNVYGTAWAATSGQFNTLLDDDDDDQISDTWEQRYFGNLNSVDAHSDWDGDSVSDANECLLGLNPLLSDTDGDLLDDHWEILLGRDPNHAEDSATDTDGDGQPDVDEVRFGTNPNDRNDAFHLKSENGEHVLNLDFTAMAGHQYVVQWSEDLNIWHNGRVLDGSNEAVTVAVEMALQHCFYRVNGTENKGAPAVKICVISDTHYLDSSLLDTNSPDFQVYLAEDRKLIAESSRIMDVTVAAMIAEHPDVLLVTGDLTKDGELVCHEALSNRFAQIEATGIKVVVCPGNHDINNLNAVQYNSTGSVAVASITPEQFETNYGHCGFDDALSRDVNSLSFITEPVDGLWILSIDSCLYNPTQVTAGEVSAGTLSWITGVLADAAQSNKTVLAMMHHGVIPHYAYQTALFPEYVANNHQEIADTLIAGKVGAVFTGHYHANDVVKYSNDHGLPLFDVETGSTVTWPCPYRVIFMTADGMLDIHTKHIEQVDGINNFPAYAHSFLNEGLRTLSSNMLVQAYGVDPAQAGALAPAMAASFTAHYAGDEGTPDAYTAYIMSVLGASPNPLDQLFGATLQSLWNDPEPADNNVKINVLTGGAAAK